MERQYDHYIAVDWSQRNMAIARMTGKSNKVTVIDVPSDVKELKLYLGQLKGSKILTIEETTTTQWLYTELVGHVEKIFACDPYRNKLLSEGAKTDKIDAVKLVQLLRAGLMKEVYHSGNGFVELRRLVSGYDGLVRAGVRLKNQRQALLRAKGKVSKDGDTHLGNDLEQFVLDRLDEWIKRYEEDKARYEEEFWKQARRHVAIRHQMSLAGIGIIGAVRIVARVVIPQRFRSRGEYWSYCGLIRHERISGGKSYGQKEPRYCRELKCVYKTAALAAITGNNYFRDYYDHLIREKRYSEDIARNALARRIATLSWGVFKSGKKFEGRNRTQERKI
jgi:transposase